MGNANNETMTLAPKILSQSNGQSSEQILFLKAAPVWSGKRQIVLISSWSAIGWGLLDTCMDAAGRHRKILKVLSTGDFELICTFQVDRGFLE